MRKKISIVLLMSSFLLPVAYSQSAVVASSVAQNATSYSAEQLQQDFRFMQESIAKTHPDVAHTADIEQLNQAYAEISKHLVAPMTRDEFWRLLSTLNPIFADAHLVIAQPDRQGQTEAHLKAGGRLFPYEVYLDGTGAVYISAELGGKKSAHVGARIEMINGVPAREIAAELLARSHGDTSDFRANVLARRWWFMYWKMYGTPARYDLLINKTGKHERLQVPGSTNLPALQVNATQFEQSYHLELLPGNAALLTVNGFYWPDKELFYAFAERAFRKIHEAKVTTLLIDIRENPGGDDDMWKKGILKYIADKPYQHGSTYRKKVIEGRQSETEKLGAVIHGSIQTWEQPELNNALHFSGKVYVLYGRYTYSSAILFNNTMQDFGFGTIVGERGYVRTSQTGGTQDFLLPNTGLDLGAPRFVLDRPAGAGKSVLVQPDIILPDDPFDSRVLVDALLARIGSATPAP